ncbi:MAG: hypothetical protein HY880_04345 [Deltaproteobacteria bacterium]|nr:hypothetical protein [Deltaproteobacteria bacterium]
MKNRGTIQKGALKKSIDTENDPYLPKIGPHDMAMCKKCSAVYQNKRWTFAQKAVDAAKNTKLAKILCPACQKIKDNFVGGFVTIAGEFFKEHEEEILNLVKNKETRAMHNNPLDRIIKISKKKDYMEITTTTDKLAQRIGQMLKKAFNGCVEYKWSSDVKLARVMWTR